MPRVEQHLADGQFGPVSRGTMRGVNVAVKELRASCSDEEELAFYREAFIISQFSHANIIIVLAVTLTGQKVRMLARAAEQCWNQQSPNMRTYYVAIFRQNC